MKNISFMPVTGKINISGIKEILLNPSFQATVTSVYNKNPDVVNYNNSNSMKDMISSTFSTPVEPAKEQAPVVPEQPSMNETNGLSSVSPSPQQAVSISAIPKGADDISYEPLNMSLDPSVPPLDTTTPTSVVPDVNPTSPEVPANPLDLNISSLDDLKVDNSIQPNTSTPTQSQTVPTQPVEVGSATNNDEIKDFGGGSSSNIFDVPTSPLGITENEVNNIGTESNIPSVSPVDSVVPINPTLDSTPLNDTLTNEEIMTTLSPLKDVAQDNSELKSLLSEYAGELAKSAENKIKGAEIDKNIAVIVNKIVKSLSKSKDNDLVESNSGATLLNNDNSLNEQALDSLPSDIMPFAPSAENNPVLKKVA